MSRVVHIGDSPPRPDGMDKATGHAKYVDDLTRPGMLFGATIRSPHPHARIRSMKWNAEAAPEGSVCVTAEDIPGANGVQLLDDTWPILAEDSVQHMDQAVALVAAPTRMAARAARDALTVDYEPLDPVLTWDKALAGEPLNTLTLENGNLDQGFAEADHIVEAVYETGHQEHIYIECQGMLAWWEEDGTLEVVGSMQCPYYVVKALTHAFDLPEEKVRVRAPAVGGGFGGKEDYPSLLAIHAGLLARKTGKPVKIIYDRHEDIVATTKRHPARVRHRTGVKKDGTLTAMEIDVVLDGGAFRTLSPVVLSRGVIHATGPYRCDNVRVTGAVLKTHTAPNAAFRGFGAPQVIFAAERHMDRIGRVIGIDPLTLRERTAVRPGDRLATGQVLKEDASAHLCLETVERATDFRRRWHELETERAAAPDDGKPRRGLGLSLYFHGAGFTGSGEHRMASPVTVRLTADGRIELLTVQTDMGQGSIMVLPQIAAEAAGVGLDDIVMPDPDTAIAPDSGPTVASRTTMVVGGTLARAVERLSRTVLTLAAKDRGPTEFLAVRDGEVFSDTQRVGSWREVASACFARHGDQSLTLHHEPPAWQIFDETTYHGVAYATYGWGADVVELEVDPDTLQVRPVRATVACEVGRVIHEHLCRGQIEGGTLQAVAWGYLEELKLSGGRYLNDRLQTYLIPTIQDAPIMDVHLLENPWEGGAFGAKGVGELPMDGGAPAVVAAIENALGIRSDVIPATPERLLAARAEGQIVDSPGGEE